MKSLPHPRRVLALVALGATLAATSATSSVPAAEHATTACRSAVSRAVIPPWARGGFSAPRPRPAHVLGHSGRILAIFFATPLRSPPPADHNNKILWVAGNQVGVGDLRIRAQRMQGATLIGKPVARRVAGGLGPSIIDLPAAGCWRFTLTWPKGSDRLDVRYAR